MRYLLIVLSLFFFSTSFSQTCNITLTGVVIDEGSENALPFTSIILEKGIGTLTDSAGYFSIENLCAGEYHIRFSHIGCETHELFVVLNGDTNITMHMHHNPELLNEVLVHGEAGSGISQPNTTLTHETIEEQSNKNLADVLEQIAGVSVIKNGSGISKPVINGLYGNRISIINNGLVQSGQQWGNDHAPEIDPYVANHVSVIKGASALMYSSNSLGGVVLVEVGSIHEDPHIHGQANYLFQTNGLGHTLNMRLEKFSKWAAWRITGTLKQSGDTKALNYFLTNTGKREGNLALQLEKSVKRIKLQTYYSLFNTEIGILRGAHIGNLTDLETAIGQAEPFFTNDKFSYSINAPRQVVQHHLVKFKLNYQKDALLLTLKYGGQLNNRKEFDVRRSGRSDVPALSIRQWNHQLDTRVFYSFQQAGSIKTGLQFNYTDNTNNAETGILPLIPDYRQYNAAAYVLYNYSKGITELELGTRYDFKQYQVLAISQNLPREIIRYNPNFSNYSCATSVKLKPTKYLTINTDLGYVLRAPEVNELYSYGLHQGVSGLEEGNPNLQQERSFKAVLETNWNIKKKLYLQVLGYYQNISNYIYLEPQEEFRLTIRGAFPVYLYKQTNATLFGTDVLVSYAPREDLKLIGKYALVRGRDVANKQPLVYMPADNLFGSITYSLKAFKKLAKTSFGLNAKYVFEQWNLKKEQDFLDPPKGYFLLGAKVSTTFDFDESSLTFAIIGDNLLNTSYRDYLNRLRYFGDDLGVNVSFRVNYSF